MNILFVAAEVTPVIKVGGLADVVGALPIALKKLGHDARVLLPRYAAIDLAAVQATSVSKEFKVPWQGGSLPVRLDQGQLADTGIPLYLLENQPLFEKFSGVYFQTDDPDDARHEFERFTFFPRAVLEALKHMNWKPDVIHCHDWHTALLPTLAAVEKQKTFPGTLLTIHNLNNQGRWHADEVFKWLGLRGDEHPSLQLRDSLGNLNIFQQGIVNADRVNTVSPNYAQEILTAEYGEGLSQNLLDRPRGVSGILNGIDLDRFNPATDQALVQTFDQASVSDGKAANQAALQQELGLPKDPRAHIIGSVGRLNDQKGYQLLPEIIQPLMKHPVQLVILGSGSEELERTLLALAKKNAKQLSLTIKFDPALAQRIYAASDSFLMPSKFEPCGLGQMIAMRYGTLPIVRDTGGLHDTVIDLKQEPQAGTGFVFKPFTSASLLQAVEAAFNLYQQPAEWSAAVHRAMQQDFSWERSAQTYAKLYGEIKT